MVVLDYTGKIIAAAYSHLKNNFLKRSIAENKNIYDLLAVPNKRKLANRFAKIKKGISVPPIEYELIGKSNTNTFIEVISKVSSYNDQPAIFALVRDVTANKKREKLLLDTIVSAEERERQRFAKDLHDELGPFLSGLNLYLDELDAADLDSNRKKMLIDYLKQMAGETIVKIRSVLNNLMPQNLQDFGLVKTLEKIIERYNVTGSIHIEMKVTRFSGDIDRSLEFIIYRTIIELINNTIKHAGANTACIELITGHAVIRLKYMDNGIGFDLQQILMAEKGIGLIAIIQRIRLIQGRYRFKHLPGKGIEFEFRLPL
jgi:signal transduction histidine kinase